MSKSLVFIRVFCIFKHSKNTRIRVSGLKFNIFLFIIFHKLQQVFLYNLLFFFICISTNYTSTTKSIYFYLFSYKQKRCLYFFILCKIKKPSRISSQKLNFELIKFFHDIIITYIKLTLQ